MSSLSRQQKAALLKDGFLPKEIYQLSNATGGDQKTMHIVRQQIAFSSKTFRSMRNSRKNYIRNLKKIGWNEQEIKAKISSYYVAKKNIFSFLKLEYSPTKRLTDYQAAIKLRERSKISRVFGRAYGRSLHAESLPRNLPKRPLYPKRPKLIRRVRRTR